MSESERAGVGLEGIPPEELTAEGTFPLELSIRALQDILDERGKTVAVAPSMRLDALGVDSLDVAEFFVRLEELSGRFVDAASADRLDVVGDLARLRPLAGVL